MSALHATLGGTLERHADGWRWRDGTPAPEVTDMLLDSISPNFRCSAGCVEIPHDWRKASYWPGSRIDTQAANAIAELIRDAGAASRIYAEGLAEWLDDHRLRKHGWVVPIAQWDAAMRELCGAWWPEE